MLHVFSINKGDGRVQGKMRYGTVTFGL